MIARTRVQSRTLSSMTTFFCPPRYAGTALDLETPHIVK